MGWKKKLDWLSQMNTTVKDTAHHTTTKDTARDTAHHTTVKVTAEDTFHLQTNLPPKKNHPSQNLLLQKNIQQGMLHPSHLPLLNCTGGFTARFNNQIYLIFLVKF